MNTKSKILIIGVLILLGIAAGLVYFNPFQKIENAESIPAALKKAEEERAEIKNIRQPAVAGQFYPENRNELSKIIDDYLKQAEVEDYKGTPQVLIAPHAGYIYSGKVAAYAFKQLKDTGFKRVVLIGRSHQYSFSGIAADENDAWSTPLGEVKVDQDFIKLLGEMMPAAKFDSKPHFKEHSLEVMAPFLIKVLGSDIKIVPLLFGDEEEKTIEDLGQALLKLTDRQTVIIVSSDLSHYPAYSDAVDLDKKTIGAILASDILKFNREINKLQNLNAKNVSTFACAGPAIKTALVLAKNLGLKSHLLKYANSGDYFPETKEKVVGYAAIAFYNLSFDSPLEETIGDVNKRDLHEREQKIALEIARRTLEMAFEKKDYQPQISDYPIFDAKRGAFVTLRKHGRLRGCIGAFEPDKGLGEVIKDMALASAFNDRRFSALRQEELEEVEIEISVLSPREKISDHNVIEAGKHGVYIQKGSRSGVYLPQVATEQGWNKETFLNSLCAEKAGLERDCWKNGSADLYIFTAQIFEED